MTRVVVHIDRIVLDPTAAAGRGRAELAAALGAALTDALADSFTGDVAWAGCSVDRLAVAASGTDPATLAGAVARAVGGLAAVPTASPWAAAQPGRLGGERR